METDPTRMCELLVGLPDVHILGVDDQVNGFLCIYIESRAQRPGCARCYGDQPVRSDRVAMTCEHVLHAGQNDEIPIAPSESAAQLCVNLRFVTPGVRIPPSDLCAGEADPGRTRSRSFVLL